MAAQLPGCAGLTALLLLTTAAQAGPIGALIATIAGAFKGIAVAKLILGVVINAGLSLLSQALRKKSGRRNEPGLQNQFKGRGATASETAVLGRAAVLGHQIYHNSEGTNNIRYHDVIELGGLPGATMLRLIIDGEYSDLGSVHADWGNVISSKDADDGGNRAWIKTYDGSQTTADAKLVELFGADPDRPWTTNHILAGKPLALMTYEYDRKRFQHGVPELRFEMLGSPLYDPRSDSSVGGSGAQRHNTPASWAQTENLVLIIYNIMRGIDLPGGAVWGGGCDADDLPIANWVAAMNACDVDVDGRPKYRGGIEVKFTEEPRTFIADLLSGCAAQMVELGGVWRIQVDARATAVISVTDDDMSVSHDASLDPFPGLDGRGACQADHGYASRHQHHRKGGVVSRDHGLRIWPAHLACAAANKSKSPSPCPLSCRASWTARWVRP